MTTRSRTLIILSLILGAAVFLQGPIHQDQTYHVFADQRTIAGVPNGANVLSNVLFVIVGFWGAGVSMRRAARGEDRMLFLSYSLFFSGVLLSGIGSMYYHLAPSDAALFWDRLPMSLAFMALLASLLSEVISRKAGALLLAPLLLLGAASVLYWGWTNDLRPYAVVQFLPVVLVPLALALYRPPREYAAALWTLVGLYVIAKVFEHFDRAVFALVGFVSGHTIKHVVAALGVAAVLRMVSRKSGPA